MDNSDFISWEHRTEMTVESILNALDIPDHVTSLNSDDTYIGDYKLTFSVYPSPTPSIQETKSFNITLSQSMVIFNLYGNFINGKVFVNEVEKTIPGDRENSHNFFREDLDSEEGKALLQEIQAVVNSGNKTRTQKTVS